MARHIAGIIIRNSRGRKSGSAMWDFQACLETLCPNSIWSIIRNALNEIQTHSGVNWDQRKWEIFAKNIIAVDNSDDPTLYLQNAEPIFSLISSAQCCHGSHPLWILTWLSGDLIQIGNTAQAEGVIVSPWGVWAYSCVQELLGSVQI